MALAREYGMETIDMSDVDNVADALIELTGGRGPDGVLDAVGMEAHGNPVMETAIKAVGYLPDVAAKPMVDKMGIDRIDALTTAIKAVRRGGTVSVSGVYGGEVDPMPMMEMFDRGITMRLGQCHVKRWVDEIVPVVMQDGDVLGLETLATHRPSLEEAPAAYEMFQQKADGCIKVVLKP
jgi:threonine dehydrogenase-like Zn-dependent dehydrogenase